MRLLMNWLPGDNDNRWYINILRLAVERRGIHNHWKPSFLCSSCSKTVPKIEIAFFIHSLTIRVSAWSTETAHTLVSDDDLIEFQMTRMKLQQQPFKSSLNPVDSSRPNSKSHSKSHPFDESILLGADTFAGASMILIGTIMYGIFGILNRLSMLGKSSTPYQSAAAMEVAECCKFIVTALLLLNEEGISKSLRSIKMVAISEWFFFAIPAAIYSITNNLDFYILQYMDPGSMQVVLFMESILFPMHFWLEFAFMQWIDWLLGFDAVQDHYDCIFVVVVVPEIDW